MVKSPSAISYDNSPFELLKDLDPSSIVTKRLDIAIFGNTLAEKNQADIFKLSQFNMPEHERCLS